MYCKFIIYLSLNIFLIKILIVNNNCLYLHVRFTDLRLQCVLNVFQWWYPKAAAMFWSTPHRQRPPDTGWPA